MTSSRMRLQTLLSTESTACKVELAPPAKRAGYHITSFAFLADCQARRVRETASGATRCVWGNVMRKTDPYPRISRREAIEISLTGLGLSVIITAVFGALIWF
jgi:hypothetical protein